MHEVELAPPQNRELRAPELATLPTRDPSLDELFAFMSEAELRFRTLRMRVEDWRQSARGEETETSEVWLRHPGQAKVVQSRGEGLSRDFDIWLTDGETVQTYDARSEVATRRSVPRSPRGAQALDLPPNSRVYVPVTPLPAETLVETFVHPRGFCRNVLSTGVTFKRGTADVAGREALLLRCDHPRTSHVLTDRPDHWLEIAVDFQTGMILLLAEHVGGRMTRRGAVISLGLDEPIPDDAFRVHISDDTRLLY